MQGRSKSSRRAILPERLPWLGPIFDCDQHVEEHALQTVIAARPDVYAHNIETVERLTPSVRDARCDYDTSLEVLRHAKQLAPQRLTKSSIMVGFGETNEEVLQTMRDLRAAHVDVVTIGQYLQPTRKHLPVNRFVHPDEFAEYREYVPGDDVHGSLCDGANDTAGQRQCREDEESFHPRVGRTPPLHWR